MAILDLIQNKSGIQQHFDENEKLREAANRGIISNELYNKMGGFNFIENVPYAGTIGTALGSTGYNLVQSIRDDQPILDGIGDVVRNTMGAARGLTKEEKDIYDNILGRREPTLTDTLVNAPGNITNKVGDLFFSPAAAAEPTSSQKFSQQFSVTQPSQFDFKGAQLFDPTNIMRGSVVEDVVDTVDTPIRQFGNITGGIVDGSVGQRYNVDNPELFFSTKEGQAPADEEQDFFDYLQNLSGGVVDFAKDIAGRTIASQALGTGLGMAFGPIPALAGGIFGALKGGNMFEPSQSQLAFNALTPQGQAAVGDVYGSDGIMAGYNPVSAFGRGPIGAIDARLEKIATRRAPQTDFSKQRAKDLFAAREKIMQTVLDSDSQSSDKITSSVRGQKAGVMDDDPFGGVSKTTDSDAGGSSKIVCTMMNESYGFGNFRNKIWLKQSKDLAPEYQKGYHILFLPLVKMAKTNKTIKKVLEHIAVHRTIDIRQESRGKTHILGRLYRKVLEPICYWVGKYAKR